MKILIRIMREMARFHWKISQNAKNDGLNDRNKRIKATMIEIVQIIPKISRLGLYTILSTSVQNQADLSFPLTFFLVTPYILCFQFKFYST